MILGILCWTASALGNTVIAYLLYAPLRPQRLALRPAAFMLLHVAVTTFVQLTAGLLGWLKPVPLGAFGALATLLALAYPSTRRALLGAKAEARLLTSAIRDAWRAVPVWLKGSSAGLLLILAARFVFLIWALPPFVWDSLTYHLPNVAAWTQAGRIFVVDSPVNRMLSPANYEALATWFTVFLHHDVVVEASGLPAYLLGVAAVYALGRSMGLASWSSWLAALGYATTPALLLAATGTKNDPMMASLFLTMMALGWNAAADRSGESRSGEWILVALAFLLGLGTKAYMLQMIVGLAAALALLARPGWSTSSVRNGLESAKGWWGSSSRSFRTALPALLAAGIFLGGYWYARNWALTGNPLFPYGVKIGSYEVVPAAEEGARAELQEFATNLRSLAERFGDKRRRISPDLPETTGWGWVAYGMGLAALVWGLVRRPRQRILFVGLTVALLLVVLASPTALWLTRFLAWYAAGLCLAVADALEFTRAVARPAYWGMAGLFVVTGLLNVAMTLNYNVISPEDLQSMLRLPTLERDASRLRLNVPEGYETALEIVPREDVLGYNLHGNGFIYPLYRSDFSQRLAYIAIPEGSSCQSIAASMEARGTRYLFVGPVHTEDWVLGLLDQCATQGDILRERTRNLYVIKRR